MYALIALYNFLFFSKFWKNPYLNHTSEIATTFFPHWHWIGNSLRKLKFPFTDQLYYKYPASIPFLSTFYPPHFLSAFIGSFLSLDNSFRLFTYLILSHYILGSFLAFEMFSLWTSPPVALFGALTLMYSGYSIKIQQPCIAYTLAWIPGIFLGGGFGAFSFAMVVYAGYYPIFVYVLPFILYAHPVESFFGCILGLPQLILFFVYLRKSVRWKNPLNQDKNFGRVPILKLLEFFLPIKRRIHTHGVMFMEMCMYMSPLIFLFMWFSHSRFWIVLLFGILVTIGVIPAVQRIPARALYLMTLSLSILAVDGLAVKFSGIVRHRFPSSRFTPYKPRYLPLLSFYSTVEQTFKKTL